MKMIKLVMILCIIIFMTTKINCNYQNYKNLIIVDETITSKNNNNIVQESGDEFETKYWFLDSTMLTDNGQSCSSSLNCKSQCCSFKNTCVDQSACKNYSLLVYLLVAILSLIFIIGVLIYFVISIKHIKESIAKMQLEMEERDLATEKLMNKKQWEYYARIFDLICLSVVIK